MLLFPFVGALLQAFIPPFRGVAKAQVGKWLALTSSVAASICGIVLVASMQMQTADPQAVEVFSWIGSYAISYDMAIDGLNALIVVLVSMIFPILIAAEWNQKSGLRGMHALFLLLQSALVGAVCSQDLFLQFFFWGLSALPFYFFDRHLGRRKQGEGRFSLHHRSLTGKRARFRSAGSDLLLSGST
jgi:NADH:ubiquinone oxidoreductase subunit 4 (subunit M)